MLSPEVWNFPAPRAITTSKRNLDLEKVQSFVNMNCFYKSIVITIPDELHTPSLIEEALADCDYYRISDCPLTVFLEQNFIENFVKNGKLYCLSADRDCIIDNCAAVTPDGILTIHIPDYIFQCLGLQGIKQPHNFYEIRIDLKSSTQMKKFKIGLTKLNTFNFDVLWEPHDEDICPSSIAKYFYEQNLKVTAMSQELKKLSPDVSQIPGTDADPSEMSEWIGMLALGCDLSPAYDYVSSYSEPDCENPIETTRISLMILKGFFTPKTLNDLCDKISSYVTSRKMDNYWASLSIQSHTDCLWRWNYSSPSTFQSHYSSTDIFFTKDTNVLYSVGEVKFS